MDKQPLLGMVQVAFATARSHAGLLLKFAWVPLGLTIAIDLFLSPALERWPAKLGWGAWDLWQVLESLINLAVRVPFIVQTYRLFLLGPAALAGDGYFRFGQREFRVFLALIAASAVADLPFQHEGYLYWTPQVRALHLLSIPGEAENVVLLGLATLAVLLYWPFSWLLVARLAFIFPTLVLDRPLDLRTRWAELRGRTWQFFWGLVEVSFLVVLLGTVLNLGNSGFPYSDVLEHFAGTPQEALAKEVIQAVRMAVDWGVGFVLIVLWAALTSAAYARLTGYPAEGLVEPARRRLT